MQRQWCRLQATKGNYQMANKAKAPATTKPAVTVAPVPAPKGAAPAPKAAPAAPAAFAGFTHPVTNGQLQHFINSQCGGNAAFAGIVALPNLAPGTLPPFLRAALTNTKKGGRPAIVNALLWGFANGHNGPVPVAGAYQYFKTHGLTTQGYADLLALLNGGFSASSKTWGQPFAKLVVLPQAPASK